MSNFLLIILQTQAAVFLGQNTYVKYFFHLTSLPISMLFLFLVCLSTLFQAETISLWLLCALIFTSNLSFFDFLFFGLTRRACSDV